MTNPIRIEIEKLSDGVMVRLNRGFYKLVETGIATISRRTGSGSEK